MSCESVSYVSGRIAYVGSPVSGDLYTDINCDDGGYGPTYTLHFVRSPMSTDNTGLISTSCTALSTACMFSVSTTSYNVVQPYSDCPPTFSLRMTTVSPYATLNYYVDSGGGPFSEIVTNGVDKSVSPGPGTTTIFQFEVVAESADTRSYSITLTRGAADTNSALSSLTVSEGSISFSPTTFSYLVAISSSVVSLNIGAVPDSPVASVTIDSTPSQSLDVTPGADDTVYLIVVTPEAGSPSSSTTTLTVHRQSSVSTLASLSCAAPADLGTFAPDTVSYTASVAYATSGYSCSGATTSSAATLQVQSTIYGGSGTFSGSLALGANTLTVLVKAEDTTFTTTYTITITRGAADTDAALSSLTVSAGSILFSPTTYSYSIVVGSLVSLLTIEAVPASPVASVAIDSNLGQTFDVTPSVGDSLYYIVVTSEAGGTNTISLNVHRQDDVSTLTGLSCAAPADLGTFSPTTYSYTASVPSTTTGYSCSGATTSPTATFSVQGTSYGTSGTFTGMLAPGANILTVLVEAEDTTFTNSYTITITRSLSSAPPSAPLNVTCTPLSLTSYRLAWLPPATVGGSSLTGYRAEAGGTTVFTGPGLSVVVTVAQQGGSRSARVLAANVDGEGPWESPPGGSCAAAKGNDTALASLGVAAGTPGPASLSPAFAPDALAYTYVLDAGRGVVVGTVTLVATPRDPWASVTTPLVYSVLGPGPNTALIVVAAQDGVAKRTYVVTLVNPTRPAAPRAPSVAPSSSSTGGGGVTATSVALTWGLDASTADNCTLLRNGSAVATVPSTSLGLTDTLGILPETAYAYTLVCTNALGDSAPSSPATVVVTPSPSPIVTSVAPRLGPAAGGLSVTVAGSGFGHSAADLETVTLAGRPALGWTWVSSTQLVAVSPPFPASAAPAPTLAGEVAVRTLSGGPSVAPGPLFAIFAADVAPPLSASCANATSSSLLVRIALRKVADGSTGLVRAVATPLAPAGGRTVTAELSVAGLATSAGLALDLQVPGLAPLTEYGISVHTVSVSSAVGPAVSLATAAAGPCATVFEVTAGVGPFVGSVRPSVCPVGDSCPVTILGARFGSSVLDVQELSLAGSACTSTKTWVSATKLLCVAGPVTAPASGSVAVRVWGSAPAGSGSAAVLSTGSVPFAFIPAPPVVLDARPRVFSVLGGRPVTLAGRGFNSPAATGLRVTLAGAECSSPLAVSASQITCTSPTPPEGWVLTDPVPVVVSRNGLESAPVSASYLSARDVFLFGTGCEPVCSWNAACIAGRCIACIAGFANPPACDRPLLGITLVGGAPGSPLTTNEDGASLLFVLTVGAAPQSPVVVAVAVSDPLEAEASARSLEFGASDWSVPQTVTVTGIPDAVRDGTTSYEVSFSVASGPTAFAEIPAAQLLPFRVANNDSRPVAVSLSPRVAAMVGVNVTLTARNLDRVIHVNVSDEHADFREVSVVRRSSNLRGPALRALASPASAPAPALEDVVVSLPPINRTGYVDVRVLNTDGAIATLSGVLFLTADCPYEGQYGLGVDCRPCPTGAYCPGGYRMRPLPGYWSPNEAAGSVVKCENVAQCPGCPDPNMPVTRCFPDASSPAPCATGYTGFACSECSPGFERSFGVCAACAAPLFHYSMVLVDVAVWTALTLSAWFFVDRDKISAVLNLVMVLQDFGTVGQMVSAGSLPKWLLTLFSVLYKFSGDVTFMNPKCDGTVDYELDFFVRLAYLVGLGLPMHLGCVILRLRARRSASADSQAGNRAEFYAARARRALVLHLTVVSFGLTLLSLEALGCSQYGSGPASSIRLITRPYVRCFSSAHAGPFVAGSLLLLTVVLGWPVLYYFSMRRHRVAVQEALLPTPFAELADSQDSLASTLREADLRRRRLALFEEAADLWTEPWKPAFAHLWILERVIAFAIAGCTVGLATNPNSRLGVLGALYATFVLLLAVFRPLHSKLDNLGTIAVNLTQLLAISVVFVSSSKRPAWFPESSILTLVHAVTVFILLSIAFFVWFGLREILKRTARPDRGPDMVLPAATATQLDKMAALVPKHGILITDGDYEDTEPPLDLVPALGFKELFAFAEGAASPRGCHTARPLPGVRPSSSLADLVDEIESFDEQSGDGILSPRSGPGSPVGDMSSGHDNDGLIAPLHSPRTRI